ncbi:MAG: hypothetical protein Q7J35_14240 [Candidatus Methanoperedens sp.]|nr:hypothetical protein [Candidatus Methanoperedens sp.]
MVRITLVRIPDSIGEEIDKIAESKGLAFATMIRSIVVEHLNESKPAVNPTKTTAGAASTTA